MDPHNKKLYKKSIETFCTYINFYDSLQHYQGLHKETVEICYKVYSLKSFEELSIQYQNLKDLDKKLKSSNVLIGSENNNTNKSNSCCSFDDEYFETISRCCEDSDICNKMYLFSYECAKVHLNYGNNNLFEKYVWEGIKLSRLMCDIKGVKMGMELLNKVLKV
ncbi:hypothetical protein COBT_003034 [Conglomerata obtusa]